MLSFGQKFSPVRGSILLQFRSLESPEFILLAIELSRESSLKSATVWNHNKYGCRCKASIVKRRGQVIYELVREPDV